jgi:tripartite ATP-independent transporter DctM subunit
MDQAGVMEPLTLAFLGMAAVIVLVAGGMPIAFVSAAVGLGGLVALRGLGAAGALAGTAPHSEVSSYTLVVVPFFIMMGSFASSAGITTDLYRMAKAWLGHLPGGLAIATTWGTALWSAISGSSTATAAVMGRMAVPEMLAHGYDRRLAAGAVAAGAAMDALIPPSVVMIVYGLLTESSIGPLLIAGFIPGFLEAFSFAAIIYVMAVRNPVLAPPAPRADWGERGRSLFRAGNWSFLGIFIAVFGGIYFGVFTPTEAGAIGAFGTFLTALGLGRLNRHTLMEGLLETGKVSVMIFIIIAGVLIFSRFLAFSGFTQTATDRIVGARPASHDGPGRLPDRLPDPRLLRRRHRHDGTHPADLRADRREARFRHDLVRHPRGEDDRDWAHHPARGAQRLRAAGPAPPGPDRGYLPGDPALSLGAVP